MTRAGHRSAWLLSLALAATGALAAHGLAYRLVEPDAERRRHLLQETGHGYFDPTQFGSLLAALILVGFAGHALAGGRRIAPPPLSLFALAPPVGFALQEQAEYVLHTGSFSAATLLAPTFVVGLLLQLPFAVVALLAARTLLAAAAALGMRLGSTPHFALAPDASLTLSVVEWAPAAPTLVGARGQRAPPSSPVL
jgi:hypothetical protein